VQIVTPLAFFVDLLCYRFGLGPQPSNVPDHRMVELVTGADRLPTGRALDLGCGTGRNALFLASHGWDTTGVEMAGSALDIARREAAAAGLSVRFVQGDVTRLPALGIGDGYRLLIDGGCYHMIPPSRRDDYAEGVSRVAAAGARLVMVGFARLFGLGMEPAELIPRMRGWRLLNVAPVPGEQMAQYVSRPAAVRAAVRKGRFRPLRYELEREAR
jgi:SAM-dependent methyltransferase